MDVVCPCHRSLCVRTSTYVDGHLQSSLTCRCHSPTCHLLESVSGFVMQYPGGCDRERELLRFLCPSILPCFLLYGVKLMFGH